MLLDKTNMEKIAGEFNASYRDLGVKFDLDAYERRAEELSRRSGEGYNIAFRETFVDMYKALIDSKINGKTLTTDSGKKLFNDFTNMMNSYIADSVKEGSISFLSPNGNLSPADVTVIRQEVLAQAPTNAMKSASQKFKSGELTVDSALEYMRSKKGDMQKADAVNLTAYAAALEERTSSRSWRQVFGNLFTHIKEKLAISSLKKAAHSVADPETLKKEALAENSLVTIEKNKIGQDAEEFGASLESRREAIKERLNLRDALEKKPEKVSERVDGVGMNPRTMDLNK